MLSRHPIVMESDPESNNECITPFLPVDALRVPWAVGLFAHFDNGETEERRLGLIDVPLIDRNLLYSGRTPARHRVIL
jgi:hypothetical protein